MIILFFPVSTKTLVNPFVCVVHATNWADSFTQADEESDLSEPSLDEPEDESKGLVKTVVNLIMGLLDWVLGGIRWVVDNFLGFSIDQIILGKSSIMNVNFFRFELEKGNIYGVIGAFFYTILRTIIYSSIVLIAMYYLIKNLLFPANSGVQRNELKNNILDMITKMLLLGIMPQLLNLSIVARDAFIGGALQTMYGSDSLLDGFSSALQESDSILGIFTAILYLSAIICSFWYGYQYVCLALSMMIGFFSFPIILAFPGRTGKTKLTQWTTSIFADIMTPIIDAILLCLPLTTMRIAQTSGAASGTGIVLTLITAFLCWAMRILRVDFRSRLGLPETNSKGLSIATAMAAKTALEIGRQSSENRKQKKAAEREMEQVAEQEKRMMDEARSEASQMRSSTTGTNATANSVNQQTNQADSNMQSQGTQSQSAATNKETSKENKTVDQDLANMYQKREQFEKTMDRDLDRLQKQKKKLETQLSQTDPNSSVYTALQQQLKSTEKDIEKLEADKKSALKAMTDEINKNYQTANPDDTLSNLSEKKAAAEQYYNGQIQRKRNQLENLKKDYQQASNESEKRRIENQIKSTQAEMKDLQEQRNCEIKDLESSIQKEKSGDLSSVDHLKNQKEGAAYWYDSRIAAINDQIEESKKNLSQTNSQGQFDALNKQIQQLEDQRQDLETKKAQQMSVYNDLVEQGKNNDILGHLQQKKQQIYKDYTSQQESLGKEIAALEQRYNASNDNNEKADLSKQLSERKQQLDILNRKMNTHLGNLDKQIGARETRNFSDDYFNAEKATIKDTYDNQIAQYRTRKNSLLSNLEKEHPTSINAKNIQGEISKVDQTIADLEKQRDLEIGEVNAQHDLYQKNRSEYFNQKTAQQYGSLNGEKGDIAQALNQQKAHISSVMDQQIQSQQAEQEKWKQQYQQAKTPEDHFAAKTQLDAYQEKINQLSQQKNEKLRDIDQMIHKEMVGNLSDSEQQSYRKQAMEYNQAAIQRMEQAYKQNPSDELQDRISSAKRLDQKLRTEAPSLKSSQAATPPFDLNHYLQQGNSLEDAQLHLKEQKSQLEAQITDLTGQKAAINHDIAKLKQQRQAIRQGYQEKLDQLHLDESEANVLLQQAPPNEVPGIKTRIAELKREQSKTRQEMNLKLGKYDQSMEKLTLQTKGLDQQLTNQSNSIKDIVNDMSNVEAQRQAAARITGKPYLSNAEDHIAREEKDRILRDSANLDNFTQKPYWDALTHEERAKFATDAADRYKGELKNERRGAVLGGALGTISGLLVGDSAMVAGYVAGSQIPKKIVENHYNKKGENYHYEAPSSNNSVSPQPYQVIEGGLSQDSTTTYHFSRMHSGNSYYEQRMNNGGFQFNPSDQPSSYVDPDMEAAEEKMMSFQAEAANYKTSNYYSGKTPNIPKESTSSLEQDRYSELVRNMVNQEIKKGAEDFIGAISDYNDGYYLKERFYEMEKSSNWSKFYPYPEDLAVQFYQQDIDALKRGFSIQNFSRKKMGKDPIHFNGNAFVSEDQVYTPKNFFTNDPDGKEILHNMFEYDMRNLTLEEKLEIILSIFDDKRAD